MDTYTIVTEFGSLVLHFTDGNHVYASNPRESAITVNRVQYNVGCHLYKFADGSWQIGEESKNQYERRQSLHMTRVDWMKVADMYASRSAWDKAAEEIRLQVQNFVVNNSSILRDAEIKHLQEELQKAGEAELKAFEIWKAAVDSRGKAQAALNNFVETVVR